ncbi:hypothetical protein [Winogradskyella sp. UBA3174]|mgnify:CR=1 FL=1|uniref:hypothetical protein n=1 Tax=Winogradskyella sp. UBA3174 TaxID=1947785 RepID=UPI0025E6ED87|nr:hypothetical protein [Winogradskyella sp. UBA3174]|tara:strand:+ start:44519 stop:45073 length:555 start_codon:yes stop_codon:yes gene_type:complete
MDKPQQRLKKEKETSFKRIYERLGRRAIVGSIIATVIVSTPLLYALHEYVPETKIWKTFLFTYESGVWQEAKYAMWVYTSKIIPLILLTIWFFTCRHWWYHALLVPIIMYAFQAVTSWNSEAGHIDEGTFVVLLPILVVIVPSIYLIRAKMFNTINDANKTLEELEEEFKIKPKTLWGKVKQYF